MIREEIMWTSISRAIPAFNVTEMLINQAKRIGKYFATDSAEPYSGCSMPVSGDMTGYAAIGMSYDFL
jgi:hypothetical protein